MDYLTCKMCEGELEIVSEHQHVKIVRCIKCGFTNQKQHKEPEVFVIRKK